MAFSALARELLTQRKFVKYQFTPSALLPPSTSIALAVKTEAKVSMFPSVLSAACSGFLFGIYFVKNHVKSFEIPPDICKVLKLYFFVLWEFKRRGASKGHCQY